MKKILSIFIMCFLVMTLFVPSSFSQGQYSKEFNDWLKAIDAFYYAPNNVTREYIEKNRPNLITFVFSHAFLQQRRYEEGSYGKSNSNQYSLLFLKYKRDLQRYLGELWYKSGKRIAPDIMEMEIFSYVNCRRKYIDRNSEGMMGNIKHRIGSRYVEPKENMPPWVELLDVKAGPTGGSSDNDVKGKGK